MSRFIALLIMLLPGIAAGYGIKLMRDMLFGILNPPIPSLTIQFIAGLLLFIAGLAFIGGFIFYRDQKRNKLQPRLNRKR
ncbi:DUF2627 domain-containing protein [Bacillus marinisedimentorum]|uniref:DUF2627 domain-containing protein n=1 Tax=Bacillus marinisedimentorum TaxID=1821260 RepID=UPI0007E071F3|nr:DUF2627 domain-containing protein [Bacillus marinisedimentorum]